MNQTRVVKIFLIVMVVLYLIGTSWGCLMRDETEFGDIEENMTCECLKKALLEKFDKETWVNNWLTKQIKNVTCDETDGGNVECNHPE